jgi:membrane protein DedA with SNARE-associated domain
VVLVGRFTPGLRFTIFFTAGTLHVRPSVFFIYDFVGGGVLGPGAGLRRLLLRRADRQASSRTPAAPSTAS